MTENKGKPWRGKTPRRDKETLSLRRTSFVESDNESVHSVGRPMSSADSLEDVLGQGYCGSRSSADSLEDVLEQELIGRRSSHQSLRSIVSPDEEERRLEGTDSEKPDVESRLLPLVEVTLEDCQGIPPQPIHLLEQALPVDAQLTLPFQVTPDKDGDVIEVVLGIRREEYPHSQRTSWEGVFANEGEIRLQVHYGDGVRRFIKYPPKEYFLAPPCNMILCPTSHCDEVFGANPSLLTFTSEGTTYVNDAEGISLTLPKGALPDGVKLNVEVDSAMIGPFSFPEGVSPVSPILWICPQQNIPLRKPMKITLPHMTLYDEDSKLFFMKANHREFQECLTSESRRKFSMQRITHHVDETFDETQGSIYTDSFCYLCIAQGGEVRQNKRYVLVRTEPLHWKHSDRFQVDYCVIYDYGKCIKSLNRICSESAIQMKIVGKFTFDDSQIKLHVEPQSCVKKNHLTYEGDEDTIQETSVDPWEYKDHPETLKEHENMRWYPPKITMEWRENNMTIEEYKVLIKFSGIKALNRSELKDSLFLPPTESDAQRSFSGGQRRPDVYRRCTEGIYSSEYKALQTNIYQVVHVIESVPKGNEALGMKFMEKGWIGVNARPDELSLVTVVLTRIELDTGEFDVFIDILKQVEGMDQIVKLLTNKM